MKWIIGGYFLLMAWQLAASIAHIKLQGRVRGTRQPHKLPQPGATPGPATNLPARNVPARRCLPGLFRVMSQPRPTTPLTSREQSASSPKPSRLFFYLSVNHAFK